VIKAEKLLFKLHIILNVRQMSQSFAADLTISPIFMLFTTFKEIKNVIEVSIQINIFTMTLCVLPCMPRHDKPRH